MAKTKIEWTWRYKDGKPVVQGYTFNPWIGCTKVSPGCANCYAERENNKRKWTEGWGRGIPRHRTSAANWNKVWGWNKKAEKEDQIYSVFVASLADVYDHEVPVSWRRELFDLMQQCEWLDFLILTKRPENILSFSDYTLRENMHFGVSVENQDNLWRLNILEALETEGLKFVSFEPLLGPVDVEPYFSVRAVDWVIVGGESGPNARPMHPHWARTIQESAEKYHIPFFFKQWGAWAPLYGISHCGAFAETKIAMWPDGSANAEEWSLFNDKEGVVMYKVGKKKSGDILYAREYKESPFNLS